MTEWLATWYTLSHIVKFRLVIGLKIHNIINFSNVSVSVLKSKISSEHNDKDCKKHEKTRPNQTVKNDKFYSKLPTYMQVSFLPKNYQQKNRCSPHGVKKMWASLFLEQTKMNTK